MESEIRCKLPMKKKNRNKKRRGDQLTDQSPDGSSSTEQSPVFLDVVCGHNRAKLSLDRLGRGTKTACVLVDEAWMTPNQYQHVSGRGTARDWKRSIKHNGTSLKALLSNKTLCLNPPSCRCNLCNPTSPKDEKVGVDDVKEANQENLPPGSNNQTSGTGCNKSGQETAATDKQQHQQQQLQQQLQQQQQQGQQQQQQQQQQQLQQQQQQQQQQQYEDEPQPQPLVPHPPKSASLRGDVEENWTRKRKLMSALALQATSAGKKRILEYKEWRRMRKEKRLNAGSDEGTALKKIKMDELPEMESKCSPGKEVMEETSSSPNRSSLVQTCEDRTASGSVAEISLDERNLSMVKEATMLHIVTELRNYRKSLEDRIDASRRCSANLFSNEQTIVAGDNRQSVIQSHRKERTLATKNSRRSTDENPLPDLVRSHNPSNTSVLQASPRAIPASKTSLVTSGIKLPIPSPIDARPPSKLSPKTINRQFSVDQYGVLDLSTKSHDASLGYSYARDNHCQSNLGNYFLGGDDSEGEQVLDLSKNSSVSVTPPSSRTTGVQLPSFGAAKSILRPQTGSRPKKTRTRKRCPTNLDRMLKWPVNDVAKFASGITGCEEYSEILTKFGVTGASLPLLTVDHMIGTLRMRQTAAHSFRLAIDRLVMS